MLAVPGHTVQVVAKWLAAKRLEREIRSGGQAVRRGRTTPPKSQFGTRVRLAGAYLVKAVAAPRHRKAVHGHGPGPHMGTSPATGLASGATAQPAASSSSRDTGKLDGAEVIAVWLQEAERARQDGDYDEARGWVDRVLDRDSRNEAAWHMRLQLPQPASRVAAPRRTVQHKPVRTARRARFRVPVWLIALLVVGALAVLAVVQWPTINDYAARAINGFGSPPLSGPTPAPTPTLAANPSPASAPVDAQFSVSEPFLLFWGANGGDAIFGKPISPQIAETGENGLVSQVQYFERARFELQTEAAGQAARVALGRIGAEVPASGTLANPLPEGLQGDEVTFKESGISVPRKFYDFWEKNNGAKVFGYPLTPVLMDAAPDGTRVAVQYFERARFEFHPEARGGQGDVTLTNLGNQVYSIRHPGR